MTSTEQWLLIGAALLVIVAGLFASAETGLSRVSRVRIEELVRERRRRADRLRQVLADLSRYLNLLLLLRVSCELSATVLTTVLFISLLGTSWVAVVAAAGVMVVVSYVVIGVTPRTLGRVHADRVALVAAGIVYQLARILGPLPQLLITLGNALTPGGGFREGPFASEAELRDLVDLAEERRVIQSNEREMIHSVFELGDTLVREVMVPRTDIVFIERGKTLRQALSLALRSGFSRIPVVGQDEDDVVGIAYLKDVVRRMHEDHDGGPADRVESAMRPATFVPDSKPIDALLREMQAKQIHLAIVIDEYGGTAGLVTIEDILEEIVGEIADEYDVAEPKVEMLPDGAARVTSRMPVTELGELFGVDIDVEDVETVGGLLAHALGRVPIAGSTATVAGLSLTAESIEGRRNRIGAVLVRHPGEQSERRADAAVRDRENAERVDA